jgi:two-component system cell cycle response regulator DivK
MTPIHRNAARGDSTPSAERQEAEYRPALRRPKRPTHLKPLILIVEDNEDTRLLYERYLSAQGFRVQTATDGVQALAMSQVVERPDVIVMDLSMPHLDGLEATRRLKADPRTAAIPVIACTGRLLSVFVERALEAGCAAYLVKPCLPRELLAEVRRVLAGRRGAAAS